MSDMLPGMNQDDHGKRMILAFILSFVVIFGYSYFYGKQHPPLQRPLPTAVQQGTVEEARGPQDSHAWEKTPEVESSSWPEEKEVALENEWVKIVFTNLRGSIKSILLKENKLIRDTSVSLVDFQNPNIQPGALARLGDYPNKDFLDYKIVEQGSDFVVLEALSHKLQIRKKFTLGENYSVNLEIEFRNLGKKPKNLVKGYDLSTGYFRTLEKSSSSSKESMAKMQELVPVEYDYYLAGTHEYRKKSVQKVKEKAIEDAQISWGGIKTKYFVILSKALEGSSAALVLDYVVENFRPYYSAALRVGFLTLESGQSVTHRYLIYAGPKDYEILKGFGHGFESVLDFGGFWGTFSKILALGLRGINKVFHNYGIAIIILTILLKLLFYPLSAISLKSMKEMQALKPKLDELKKKFKDNPKKMQQATMELYREHNVKPLAGCLPMVVQIPIFIAFYRVLSDSIELRGANFLWINDLALADSLFHIDNFSFNLLPILNGATMFWQQSITPVTDPSQKQMKYLMPGLITVFFYGLPSGLILYWFVTTLISVLQQYQVSRK